MLPVSPYTRKWLCMLFFYLWLSVQIVAESFPVSSSGHVTLLENIFNTFGHNIPHVQNTFVSFLPHEIDIISHFIHGPTVLVIALFFYQRWIFLLLNIKKCWRIIIKIIGLTCIADVMTALFFLLFYSVEITRFPVGVGFCITAGLLLSLRWVQVHSGVTWNSKKAFILGCVQGLGLLPGVSRFASTYVAARWLKLSHKKAFEICFLIQWPLIFVGFLNSVRMLLKQDVFPATMTPHMLYVILAATGIAFYGLKYSAYLAAHKKLWHCAVYMVVPITLWFVVTFY